MIITDDFDYFKPVQISEAVKIFDKYKNKALLLAGGTDLIVKIKEDIEHPKVIIDLKGIRELKKLEFKNNSLYIGAGVTFGELLDDQTVNKKFPLLWESIRTVGSVGIRNRATLAGNICSAVPSLDSGPALLCYEAHVHVTGRSGKRKIAISSWFTGPKKNALKTGEIVLGITIPFPGKKHTGCYVKLGRYRGEDLAQAGVGILLLKDHTWRIGFCALGPVPFRALKIESLLKGKPLSDTAIEKALKLVSETISPITDIRATKEYRIHMAQVMLKRGLKITRDRLNGREGLKLGANILGG